MGFSRQEYWSGLPFSPAGDRTHISCIGCAVCWVPQLCLTLCDPMDCSPSGCSVHGDSPGKNTGVGCHARLQGIFPTQVFWVALQMVSWPSEPPGKPVSTGVVVYPFSRGSSQPRNRIWVSCIAGRFFTSWATREATEPLSYGSFDTVILLPRWFILFNWFVGHYTLLIFLFTYYTYLISFVDFFFWSLNLEVPQVSVLFSSPLVLLSFLSLLPDLVILWSPVVLSIIILW